MKYCKKCGKENKDSVGFCVSCGEVLSVSGREEKRQEQEKDVKVDVFHWYNLVVTLGLITIIRLFNTQKVLVKEAENWFQRNEYEYVVPDNIRLVMFVILVVSFILGGIRPNQPAPRTKKALYTTLVSISELIIGLIIISL